MTPVTPRARMSVPTQTLAMTESVETVMRQPSEFLRSLVTELLELCPRLEVRDPQSCHGRLVQDICLDTPSLKISKFSQIRKALIEELKVDVDKVCLSVFKLSLLCPIAGKRPTKRESSQLLLVWK